MLCLLSVAQLVYFAVMHFTYVLRTLLYLRTTYFTIYYIALFDKVDVKIKGSIIVFVEVVLDIIIKYIENETTPINGAQQLSRCFI